MKNISIEKIVICSISIVLGFTSLNAIASENGGEEPMPPEEVIALEAQNYADTYDVSFEEAVKRLSLMHDSSADQIVSQVGDDLGGIYFDNSSDFSLVINSTGKNKKLKVPKSFSSKGKKFSEKPLTQKGLKLGLTKDKVKKVRDIAGKQQNGKVKIIEKAKIPKNKVNSIRSLNSDKENEIEGYNGSIYDDKTGELVIFVMSDKNQAKALSQAKKIYPDIPLRIETDSRQATTDHTRGGAKIHKIGSPGSYCTTGFVVRDRGTNEVGVVTAGHCDFSSATYSAPDGSNYVMTRKKRLMNNKADLAFFWANHAPTSEFYPTSSATPRALVGWKSVSETEEKSFLIEGSYICHYGVASGTQSCGEVTNTSYKPKIYDRSGNYIGCGIPGQPVVDCGPYFVKVEKKGKPGQVALQCIGGDSGGPWFAYGNAYGINKGGYRSTPGDQNTCEYAYYTPIQRINDLNLTLWYGGTVSNGIATSY